MERRIIHYRGQVQGVGFRYSTAHIARQFAVSGYVRNLPNGEVELVVEGETTELDRFSESVAARMAANIDNVRVASEPATGAFADFEIRR